jgi:hypothetical protein
MNELSSGVIETPVIAPAPGPLEQAAATGVQTELAARQSRDPNTGLPMPPAPRAEALALDNEQYKDAWANKPTEAPDARTWRDASARVGENGEYLDAWFDPPAAAPDANALANAQKAPVEAPAATPAPTAAPAPAPVYGVSGEGGTDASDPMFHVYDQATGQSLHSMTALQATAAGFDPGKGNTMTEEQLIATGWKKPPAATSAPAAPAAPAATPAPAPVPV